jgi:hypothetical protein
VVSHWRSLSSHGRVLVFVARQPHARLRDVAAAARIAGHSAHRSVVRPDVPIRDPLLGDHRVGEILAVLAGTDGWPARRSSKRRSS